MTGAVADDGRYLRHGRETRAGDGLPPDAMKVESADRPNLLFILADDLGWDPAETDNRASAESGWLAVMLKQLDTLAATDVRAAP